MKAARNTPEAVSRVTPIARLLAWVFRIARGLLILGLTVQTLILVWLWPDGELEVPPFLLNRLNQQLAKHDLVLELDRAEINLRGYLHLVEPRLRFLDQAQPSVTAKSALVAIHPAALALGILSVHELHLVNAELYCPAVVSPSGTRERLIENFGFTAKREGRTWNLNHFQIQLGTIRLLADGQLPRIEKVMERPVTTPTPGDDPETIRKRFQDYARQLAELQHQLEGLGPTTVQLFLARAPSEITRIHLVALADHYHDPNHLISTGPITLGGAVLLHPDRSLRATEPVQAQIDQVSWNDEVLLRSASFQLSLAPGAQGVFRLPPKITAYLDQIEAFGASFNGGLFTVRPRSTHSLHLHAAIRQGANWLSLLGPLDFATGQAELHLRGRWDPHSILESPQLADLEDLPDFAFANRPYLQGWVSLGEGWAFQSAKLQIDSGAAHFESLQLKSVFADLTITPQLLWVHHAVLQTPGYQVTGSYFQDLETDDYRILVKGRIYPLDIAFLIPDQWWTDLWSDFTFGDALPTANIDLQGRHGAGRVGKSLFGSAALPTCVYRGVPVQGVSATIWQDEFKLDLLDLHIRQVEKSARVDLAFRDFPDGRGRQALGFQGQSTLSLDDLVQIIGDDDAALYAGLFESTGAPSLSAAGVLMSEYYQPPNALFLNIRANFSDPVIFQELPFERLAFDTLIQPTHIEIPRVVATLASGQLNGHATLTTPTETPPSLNLDLLLDEANLDQVLTLISLLQKNPGEQDPSREQSTDQDDQTTPTPGLVRLSFNGEGTPGAIETFVGQGAIAVRQARLGRFHLFGGLSRFIDYLGIPFTSTDFTSADGDFSLNDGALVLPDARIYGPTARIDANGYYAFEDDELDFKITLHPLGGVSAPVISQVLSVLNPLGNTVEIHLTGPFDEPKWSTSFSPLRMITGPSKVTPPDDDPLPDEAPTHGPPNR